MSQPLGARSEGRWCGSQCEAPLAKAWLGAELGDEVRMGPSTFIVEALH